MRSKIVVVLIDSTFADLPNCHANPGPNFLILNALSMVVTGIGTVGMGCFDLFVLMSSMFDFAANHLYLFHNLYHAYPNLSCVRRSNQTSQRKKRDV